METESPTDQSMTRLLLEGGAEFSGKMAEPDLEALALAGGMDAPVAIIPTAAAPDNNHARAGGNGKRWFEGLGARRVRVVPLVDRASADDPLVTAQLRDARLIYLLGGFTHYLAQTLVGTPAWQAALQAHRDGAVLAGSSAGAMVLAQHYFDPGSGRVYAGLGLVPRACVLPHFNSFGKSWVSRLVELLPRDVLIGLDEHTGILASAAPGTWRVHGQGAATLYYQGKPAVYQPGASLQLV